MDTHMVKKQMSNAYRYSFTRLTLNLYSYLERSSEADSGRSLALQAFECELLADLHTYLTDEIQEGKLDFLRERVMEFMEKTVSFAESFQIYEYILNRMERKYSPVRNQAPDEEKLLSRLTEYFMNSQDSVVMNSRIREIVGETPVRFTKAKFFGMVKDGLKPYAGSTKKVMEDFLERLSNFTCLKPDGTKETGFEEFPSILTELSRIDFKTMDRGTFDEAADQVAYAGERLSAYVDHCLMLQELINDLYVLCLSREDALTELGDEEFAVSLVSEIVSLFGSDTGEIPEEMVSKLALLEGKQEIYYERYSAATGGMQTLDSCDRLWKVDRLLSNSPFLSLRSLDENGKTSEEMADEAWVDKRAEYFCNYLSDLFDSLPKPVVRAVMAKILSSLPLWFHSMDEIHDYIREGLECCTDLCEKESSMELICEIMEMEYALV